MTLKNETIVDRVVERLKTQPLGDLITEADLHEIVIQAIPKAFFEKRVKIINPGTYNEKREDREPIIVEVACEMLQESVKAAVQKWMNDNQELVASHWKSVMDAGIVAYVQDIQNKLATEQVRGILREWFEMINRERQNAGLPILPPYF